MRRIIIPLFFALLVLLSGCAKGKAERQIYIMDTVCNISVSGEGCEETVGQIEDLLEKVDLMCSPTQEESEVNVLNRAASEGIAPSKELLELLEKGQKVRLETGGAFDITLGKLIELWDIGGANNIPNNSQISNALSMCGAGNFEISEGTARLSNGCEINLGGIAKGYAAGRAMEIFKENNTARALISLGGNICVWGEKEDGTPWKIGVRDPNGGASDYIGILELRDTVIAVSGDYERFFEKDGVLYHHIIDASTGKPAESDIRSVSVVCRDGARADALSTALFVMGKERALDFWRESDDFECIIVGNDMKVTVTQGLSDKLYLTDGGYSLEIADR